MRSCGKSLLIVFAIVQLAKCISSQEPEGITKINAEPNVLLMEHVEGSGTITDAEEINDYDTTLNPALNPTIESIDETTTILILADENSTNTQTENVQTASVNEELGTLTTEASETGEAELQFTEKPKCLCDCDTGDQLETIQTWQCANEASDKQFEGEKRYSIGPSESEVNGPKKTTEGISITDKPLMTEGNEIMHNTVEPQILSEVEPLTDSPTNPQDELQTDTNSEDLSGSQTESSADAQTDYQTKQQKVPQTESSADASIGSPTERSTEPEEESQTELNLEPQTVSQTAEPIEITTLPSTKPCTSVGDFPSKVDCQLYYSCVARTEESTTLYERAEKSCPTGNAFNAELGRCTRDISSCNDGSLPCEKSGTFIDPQGNTSYYWCVPRLNGGIGSFHKYRVQCPLGEVYVPQLGKCFIDINNLQNLPTNWGQDDVGESDEDDEDIIKAELKQFKLEEKVRLKEQKLKAKMEQKLQKELAKKAAKEAKEKAKLNGASKEVEQFACTEEGNFASALSVNRYFACISKKGKFKVVSMKCTIGSVFDSARAACISNNTNSADDEDD